jgi:hypothetical protein
VWDLVGDTAFFLLVQSAAGDPTSKGLAVADIAIPLWICFLLATVISVLSLSTKLGLFCKQIQLRRRNLRTEQAGIVASRNEKLKQKIEHANRDAITTLCGFAVGCVEGSASRSRAE